jgi:hypothetical protein
MTLYSNKAIYAIPAMISSLTLPHIEDDQDQQRPLLSKNRQKRLFVHALAGSTRTVLLGTHRDTILFGARVMIRSGSASLVTPPSDHPREKIVTTPASFRNDENTHAQGCLQRLPVVKRRRVVICNGHHGKSWNTMPN